VKHNIWAVGLLGPVGCGELCVPHPTRAPGGRSCRFSRSSRANSSRSGLVSPS